MALYSVDHCVGLARDLADRLSLRLAGASGLNSVRQAQDAAGWPELFISHNGVESESNPVIFIRIKNIDVGAVDIFGNSTLPFTPSLCQFAFELNGAGAPIPSTSDFSTCFYEAGRMGTVMQEYAIANGTAVSAAAVDAASPVLSLKDIDWGFKGNT